jgi:LSD1 subclass zinc finger protein
MTFNRKKPEGNGQLTQQPSPSAGLPEAGEALTESLKAHSNFIKRVSCSQCGAPKTLPSVTAYIYCDFCGALMDYDFRLANANTNAGLTNTVFHRLYAILHGPIQAAKMKGDKEAARALYRQLFTQWLQECPMAVSPRAQSDMTFREKEIEYLAESYVVKDFDPRQGPLDAEMARLVASFRRLAQPNGAWRIVGGFWEYANVFKHQMIMVYDLIHQLGVDAMDPDNPPPGVALRMEYSAFCQGWLPHLSPEDGERLLRFFGLDAQYDEIKPQPTDKHLCGVCGNEMRTMPSAKKVVCDHCGHILDIDSGDIPCHQCGALLAFPVAADRVICPYCQTDNRRV